MVIKLSEIVENFPLDKVDTLWAKILIRKLSFYVTWIFISLNVSAWGVSILSILIVIVSVILWVTGAPVYAALFANIWLILDCVDGNIARLRGPRPGGEFIDAMSGYFMLGTYGIGIGIYLDLYSTSAFLPMPWYTFLGGLLSIFNILSRLIYQKFINSMETNNPSERKEGGYGINLIDKNLGIGGFLTPLLFICAYFNFLHYLILFYFLYSFILIAGISVKLAIKSR